MTADDDALAHWLKTVQATNLGARDVLNPARASKPIGDIIKAAGGGQVFDTEPARYYKMLRDLSHEYKKS
jgi:hypothetical protein